MFHKALELRFKEDTVLQVKFQSGEVKEYDMASLFFKYPQLQRLEDRELFTSGRLMTYGIIWDDELDIEVETIYQEGKTIGIEEVPPGMMVGYAVKSARDRAGISQSELARLTGIDQSDLSKIERGVSNPSILTLQRIADALGGRLRISIDSD